MKKLLLAAVLLLVPLTLMSACHKQAAQAPVPGQVDTFDAQSYRALMDAQAAINSFKADVASGKLTLSAKGKALLNQVIGDYNAADALWQQYHKSGGVSGQAPLQNAITTLQADVNKLGVTQ